MRLRKIARYPCGLAPCILRAAQEIARCPCGLLGADVRIFFETRLFKSFDCLAMRRMMSPAARKGLPLARVQAKQGVHAAFAHVSTSRGEHAVRQGSLPA